MLRDTNNKKKHFVIVGKGGGGGIEQVQSDWAQTDNTQVDYIKNKPTIKSEWFGTQAEFDLIDHKDANTIYYIEDANGSVVHNNKTYGTKVKIENPELTDVQITSNGTYQHTGYYGYDEVTVNVPTPVISLQDKTVTQNGTVTADQGYDGLGTVTVNVPSVVYPTYLTTTYFVSNPSNSFKILETTTNIAGYRIKGASTWETPTTTITASNYGELVIEYDLTDNTTLEARQFVGCSDLVKIEFPTSITTIGDRCFSYTGLIDYPDFTYVTTAGDNIFFMCPIKSMGLTINDNVTRNYNDYTFNGFDQTKVIDKVYVNGAVYVALFYTQNNGDIDFTNGFDGLPIYKWFMYGGHMRYNLNSLKFPSTLQYLGGFSFRDCTVTNLYFYGTTPPECIPFEGNNIWSGSNITNIYVPASALTAYQNSADFADVASKIQAMP